MSSKSSISFLDLTIYKGPDFHTTHQFDLKTFQKPQNLYQYLEYKSAHPRNIYCSIILGECTRYLTRPETYIATTKTFQKGLQERKYPNKLTGKLISRVKFSERQQYLKKYHQLSLRSTPIPPIFKCHPPPQFDYVNPLGAPAA